MRPRPLLLLALLALACNRDSPSTPTDPVGPPAQAVLLGRTLDPNGTPVPTVTVTLLPPSGTPLTATSGDDARFTFEGVAPGFYSLRVRAAGGPEQNGGTVRLLSGFNTHDVLVSGCKSPYGTVRDAATGRPIAGAKVSIHSRDTVTDASGYYQVDFGCESVPGSTITMKAEHADYEPSQVLSRASMLCTCAYDFLLTRRPAG